MNSDEINRTIRDWMGYPSHECVSPICRGDSCCVPIPPPKYDSESSPRSLLGEAEKKLLANDPSCEIAGRYVTLLCQEVGIDTQRWERKGPDGWLTILITTVDGFCLANATAEQRATAIFNLIEEGKDERTESQTA